MKEIKVSIRLSGKESKVTSQRIANFLQDHFNDSFGVSLIQAFVDHHDDSVVCIATIDE